MRYRLKLLITASALLCLSLAAVAPADNCIKRIYIDGNEFSEVTAPSGLAYSYARITIGGEGNRWYLYNEYVGKMADFAIYSGILSDPCIAAHHTLGIGSDYTAYANMVVNDKALLYLKFDDASVADGTTATNSGSVTARNGTYIVRGGSAGFTQTNGICGGNGKALVFPASQGGGVGSCVDVWDAPGDFSTQLEDVTIELWVDFNSIGDPPGTGSDYSRFFQHNGDWQTKSAYGVMVDENHVNLNTIIGAIGGSDTESAFLREFPGEINDSNWHHIVVTYDSTYLPPETNSYTQEVSQDAPVLWLRFEQSPDANGLLVDSSVNNYWVKASSLVRIEKTMGSMGKAAYLNGGWVAAANQQTEPNLPTQYDHQYAFNKSAPNDITFEFWLRTPTPESVDSYAALFSDCNTRTTPYTYAPGMMRSNDAGNQKCRILLGDEDGSDPYLYTGANSWVQDANWHYYVVEYEVQPDGNGNPYGLNVKLYRDNLGLANQTYTKDTLTGLRGYLGPEMSHILIGGFGSRDNFRPTVDVGYQQYVDEFAIYAGLLSPDRIKTHYYAWRPKSCAEMRDREMGIVNYDINKDCKISFADFASFAASGWRQCNDPCDTNCAPNW